MFVDTLNFVVDSSVVTFEALACSNLVGTLGTVDNPTVDGVIDAVAAGCIGFTKRFGRTERIGIANTVRSVVESSDPICSMCGFGNPIPGSPKGTNGNPPPTKGMGSPNPGSPNPGSPNPGSSAGAPSTVVASELFVAVESTKTIGTLGIGVDRVVAGGILAAAD